MGAHPPELQGIGQRGDSKQFGTSVKMAYTWDNRVKYIVRYMYDIDNNGFLDINDFDCLAVRVTLIEARGDFPADAFASNQKIMKDLWTEIAEYDDFPSAFKVFITNQFKTIDVNGDGVVGVDEYRLDCITRSAFAKLCTEEDKKAGGINQTRYQELYADFISNTDETSNACYLFGPLKVVE